MTKPTLWQRLARMVQDGYFRQSVAAFAIKLGGAGLSFLFNLAVARIYGAAGSGVIGLAMTTSLLASVVALVGLDYVLLRSMAGDIKVGDLAGARGTLRTVVLGVAGIGSVIAVLLAVAGVPLMMMVLHDPAASAALTLSALLVVPMALVRVGSGGLRAMGSMLTAQLIDGPLAMALALAGLAVLAWSGQAQAATQAFLLFGAATAAAMVVGGISIRRRMAGWPARRQMPLRPMLATSWQISITVLSMWLADWSMLMLVGANASAAEIGQFRVAQQIAMLINLVVVTFDTVAGPRIAAAHRVGDTAGLARTYRQAIVVMTGLAGPVVLLCLLAPRWLLSWFGPDFVAAAPALQILALGQLVNVITGPAGSMLVMTGREGFSMRLSLIALVLLAALGLWLVPAYGIIGAATTLALVTSYRKLWSIWEIWRNR